MHFVDIAYFMYLKLYVFVVFVSGFFGTERMEYHGVLWDTEQFFKAHYTLGYQATKQMH